MKSPLFRVVLVAVVSVLFCLPAQALIKIGLPIWKMHQDSKAVYIGKVTAVKPEDKLVEVDIAQVLKGDAIGDHALIQIPQPAGLLSNVSVGQSVVIFASASARKATFALLHVGDTWLSADAVAGAKTPLWRATGEAQYKRDFPGTTAALVSVLNDLKAGKQLLLDVVDNRVFTGGFREVLKVELDKPGVMVGCSMQKQPPLLAMANGSSMRLLAGSEKGFTDITEKAGVSGGGRIAVGDVNGDGKIDLLVGKALWIGDGEKFTKAPVAIELPAEEEILAVAIADVTGDKKADVVALKKNGELLVFENPGAVDKGWTMRPAVSLWKDTPAIGAVFGKWGNGDEMQVMVLNDAGVMCYPLTGQTGGADFTRLTGERVQNFHKDQPKWLASAQMVPIDSNGDGRQDLLLISPQGSLLLVNRGYGCYLVNPDAGSAFQKAPVAVTAATRFAAADLRGDQCEDLIVLSDDGKLFVVGNPKPAAVKP